jgi:hypothetical protein
MSASASAFGFRPAQHWSGLERARPYLIQSTYATTIFKGDPVTLGATTALGTVIVGATTGDLLGSLAGISYADATQKPVISPYWPGAVTGATPGANGASGAGGGYQAATTSAIAWVWDDPATIFEAQTDGTFNAIANVATSAAFLNGAIGGQMNSVGASAGNTQTGLSAAKLAGSTLIATGGPAQFRVLEPGQQIDNAFLSDTYVIFQVEIAQHVYRSNKNAV